MSLKRMWICWIAIAIARDAASKDTASQEFDAHIQPFLTNYCISCHGVEKPKGKLSLHDLNGSFSESGQIDRWQRVLEAVTLHDMPPDDAKRFPEKSQREAFTKWLSERLIQSGHRPTVDHKLAQPSYGNLVNHERLFNGTIKDLASSPPRLWRMNPAIYEKFRDQKYRFAGSQPSFNQPFVLATLPGVFQDYSTGLNIDDATLSMLLANCELFTQWQVAGIPRYTNSTPPRIELEKADHKPIRLVADSTQIPTRQQLIDAIKFQFNYSLYRDPDFDESERFVNLAQHAIEKGGNAKGLGVALTAVLLQPEALYRMELGLGPADEHGRRMLSPYELSLAIMYALTDDSPDVAMKKSAHEGRLASRSDVEREVRRLLADPKIAKPRILRFFREFFGYANAKLVFKGDRIGPEFAPSIFVRDADQLILRILDEDKNVLEQLLTTDRYCVISLDNGQKYENVMKYIEDRLKGTHENVKYFRGAREVGRAAIPEANPSWRKTVRFYNLDEQTLNWQERIPLTNQRAGILTHPAWLVAFSGNFDNDPIRRGKWIREHLLADTVPEIPITVNAVLPENHSQTLRERMAVTRQEYCWKCHVKMDPLGLVFENFDDMGRYRTEELLGDKTKRPVDAQGQINSSGDSLLDGDVKDFLELTQKLAKSDRVRQSFVRHAFRYWMGRNETLSDSATLIAADQAYTQNDGSFRELLVSLLTSDSFIYRK